MGRIIEVVAMLIVMFFVVVLFPRKVDIASPVSNKTSTPEMIQTSNELKILRKEQILEKEIIIPTVVPTETEIWGVSRQVGEHTWTIKVGEDEKMATLKDVLDALNEYRRVHGTQILILDEKLVDYAQERAKYLNKIKSVDQHKGFSDFVENQNGFDKLGFTALGENISYGYKLNGVHLIEWMYAGDKPHNDNQLDNRWNYVGIGVDGLATCLVFGTGKF